MIKKKITYFLCSLLLLLLANTPAKATEECFEDVSRSIFKFNMFFDDLVLEPVAKGYKKLPKPIQRGTNNFTSNISALLSIPNSLLQGKIKQAGHTTGSFLINTTVGVLGFLNPAEKLGLKPHKEDVGQTLGSYGIGQGCYYVLPILGPTTARDSIGMIADSFIDPFAYITLRENELLGISGNSLDFYSVKGTDAVNFRSNNITSFDSMEKNSIDLYSAYKSFYLQDRENKVKNSKDNSGEWDSLDN